MEDWERAAQLWRSPQFLDCVARRCALPGEAGQRLDLEIHANDPMLRHSLRSFDPARAVGQYYNVAIQQHRAALQVVRRFFPSRGRDFRMLDFACGYGRLVRLLRWSVPPAQLWASDIQPEALEFVGDRFGVHIAASSARPGDFDPGARFDFVWVASLFSHLPQELFREWLARLLELLEPGGVLAFSVHDMALWPHAVPQAGFAFTPESESPELGSSLYGTAFATESFVRSALPARPALSCTRLARAIANHQDLYVVSTRPTAILEDFRRGPWGFVDIVDVSAERELHLVGWAASLDDGPIASVEVAVDGDLRRCPISMSRPDVGEALGDRRLERSGWETRRPLGSASAFVEVGAATRPGESALLYAGFT